jgi:hypothetical protein
VKLKHWILQETAKSFFSQYLSKFSKIASPLNQRSLRKRVVYHAVALKATSGFVTVFTDLARAKTRAWPPVKFVTIRGEVPLVSDVLLETVGSTPCTVPREYGRTRTVPCSSNCQWVCSLQCRQCTTSHSSRRLRGGCSAAGTKALCKTNSL